LGNPVQEQSAGDVGLVGIVYRTQARGHVQSTMWKGRSKAAAARAESSAPLMAT